MMMAHHWFRKYFVAWLSAKHDITCAWCNCGDLISNYIINVFIIASMWALIKRSLWITIIFVHFIARTISSMGLLPDTYNCGLGMRRECRERFPHHRFQRKPLVSDPGMHHGTRDMHVPWCLLGSLNRSDGENVPGIPCACASGNFAYLVRGPWLLTGKGPDLRHYGDHRTAVECGLLTLVDCLLLTFNFKIVYGIFVWHTRVN